MTSHVKKNHFVLLVLNRILVIVGQRYDGSSVSAYGISLRFTSHVSPLALCNKVVHLLYVSYVN